MELRKTILPKYKLTISQPSTLCEIKLIQPNYTPKMVNLVLVKF